MLGKIKLQSFSSNALGHNLWRRLQNIRVLCSEFNGWGPTGGFLSKGTWGNLSGTEPPNCRNSASVFMWNSFWDNPPERGSVDVDWWDSAESLEGLPPNIDWVGADAPLSLFELSQLEVGDQGGGHLWPDFREPELGDQPWGARGADSAPSASILLMCEGLEEHPSCGSHPCKKHLAPPTSEADTASEPLSDSGPQGCSGCPSMSTRSIRKICWINSRDLKNNEQTYVCERSEKILR